MTILLSSMVILTSIEPILEKCVPWQLQYSRVLPQYLEGLEAILIFLKLVVDHYIEMDF